MPLELYLIENKPLAICFQVVLEFIIFLISTLLWLTWCTKHIQTSNLSESKSLAFALPGYLIGWICLMVTRLLGSRLKEKFCFSFYMASGVRFMFSAMILFPEFSQEWYSVAYGIISLLCFVNTIFHIVTHPNIERRPVRRLIGPDGTLSDDPAMEMMSVKQLENYRDIIRNYMETHNKAPKISAVRSVEVITVSLHGSTGTSFTSKSSATPWMTHDRPGIKVRELSPDKASEQNTSLYCRGTHRLSTLSDGVIPATTKIYSQVRVSQMTIKNKSTSPGKDTASNAKESNTGENKDLTPTQSMADIQPSYRLEDTVGAEPSHRNMSGRIRFGGGLTIIEPDPFGSTPIPSLKTLDHNATGSTPMESNRLLRCPHRTIEIEVSTPEELSTARTIETLARGVSRFSEDQIFDTVECEAYKHRTVKPTPDTKTVPRNLTHQEHHSAEANLIESTQQQRCPHRSNYREVTAHKEFKTAQSDNLARGTSRFSEDQIFDTVECEAYAPLTVKPTPETKTVPRNLTHQEHHSAKANLIESTQQQGCPHRSNYRKLTALKDTTTAQFIETLTRGVSRFSEDQIFDTLECETYQHRTAKPTPDTKTLMTQDQHYAKAIHDRIIQNSPSTTTQTAESVTTNESHYSEDGVSNVLECETSSNPYSTISHALTNTPPTIHRVTCPLHTRQN